MHPNTVLQRTAQVFGVLPSELWSRRRTAAVVAARDTAAYCLRQTSPHLTNAQIGRMLDRDGSTISEAIMRCRRTVACSTQRAAQVRQILGLPEPAPAAHALRAVRAMHWWAAQARQQYEVPAA